MTQATVHGIPFLLDEKDSLDLAKYPIYEPFEAELVRQVVKPTDFVLDIGAHIGYYTTLLAQLARRVVAFEPDPTNFPILRQNVAIFGNIRLFQCAVGDHRTYPCEEQRSSEMVEMVAIDTLGFLPVDFIKMDIQGGEYWALKGMERLLNSCSHVKMLMEFWPAALANSGAGPYGTIGLLEQYGMNVCQVDSNARRLVSIHASNIVEELIRSGGYCDLWCEKV